MWWWTKNQHFWRTIKPFMNSKYDVTENVILCEGDEIINKTESVLKIFNEYFNQIASDIGSNDLFPDSYAAADVLSSFIAKYGKHTSIIAIKSALHEYGTFEITYVKVDHIYQILWLCMIRKLQAVMVFNANLKKLCFPTCWNSM